MKKLIVLNVFISLLVFIFTFLYYHGQSGGDMVIGVMSVIFGIVQIIIMTFLFYRKKNSFLFIIISFIIAQVIQLFILIVWGYQINEFIKEII